MKALGWPLHVHTEKTRSNLYKNCWNCLHTLPHFYQHTLYAKIRGSQCLKKLNESYCCDPIKKRCRKSSLTHNIQNGRCKIYSIFLRRKNHQGKKRQSPQIIFHRYNPRLTPKLAQLKHMPLPPLLYNFFKM